jgi:4-hydroxy-tetrahydrodipicolinate synthase
MLMPESRLTGSMVAMVTPMCADGSIDLVAWQRLLAWHIKAGTDAVVVAGTTGESACLNSVEYSSLLQAAVEQFASHGAVIAGIGSASTEHSLALLRLAESASVDAVLAVTPYYNKPPQQGLLTHYQRIADAASVPVLLYNVPSRTGVDLLPETTAELALHTRIIGLKEANATAQRLPALQALLCDDFVILSGDDNSCCASMLQGAHGVISVAANLVPAQFARLVAAACAGDRAQADAAQQRLQPLFGALNAISNPIAIKWALASVGQIDSGIRLPLIWMPADLQHQHLPVIKAAWEYDQALLANAHTSGQT